MLQKGQITVKERQIIITTKTTNLLEKSRKLLLKQKYSAKRFKKKEIVQTDANYPIVINDFVYDKLKTFHFYQQLT